MAGLLTLGFVLASALLARLVYDFGRLSGVFLMLVLGFYLVFLVVGLRQVRAAWSLAGPAVLTGRQRLGLALAVPVGLLGSVVDCMGLSFEGCSPVCAGLTRFVAPSVALLALLHGWSGARTSRISALALAFLLLVPNCRCRNPANAFWIDFLGLSPACFLSGFAVTVVALGALFTGRYTRISLALAWGTNAVLAAFFVGHHYFDWPW
jgi:hypothetical protein